MTPVIFKWFHVFHCYHIRKTVTVMHSPVFEHSDTLSFALMACILLYINGTQIRCSVFTFVQYIHCFNPYIIRHWIFYFIAKLTVLDR